MKMTGEENRVFLLGLLEKIEYLTKKEGSKMEFETADFKIFKLILQFFDDDSEKATNWINTPNPNIGNVAPCDMIAVGRSEKLLKYIEGCKDDAGW